MNSGGYRSTAAKNQAIIVVVHAFLIIIRHVLATGTPYYELDVGYVDRRWTLKRETAG
jgi:hypothetical protein